MSDPQKRQMNPFNLPELPVEQVFRQFLAGTSLPVWRGYVIYEMNLRKPRTGLEFFMKKSYYIGFFNDEYGFPGECVIRPNSLIPFVKAKEAFRYEHP